MQVIPAIDLKDGKVVRLSQGDYSRVEFFSDDAGKVAKEFFADGAKRIHVVDLDGAKTGRMVNFNLVRQLGEMGPIEVGGGIRDYAMAAKVFTVWPGTKVVLGTAAVKDPALLESLQKFKKDLLIGIDARGGKVALEGWVKKTDIDPYEFAREIGGMCSGIIFTAVERDGMLEGPDLLAIEKMVEVSPVPVIASGGVTKLEDILRIKEKGAAAVIVGKALYKGNFTLKEAIKAGK